MKTSVDTVKKLAPLRRVCGIVLIGVSATLCRAEATSLTSASSCAQDNVSANPPATGTRLGLFRIMETRHLQLIATLDGYERSGVPLVAYFDGQHETGLSLVCGLKGHFAPAGYGDDLGLFYFVPMLSRGLRTSLRHSIDLFLVGIVTLGFIVGSVGVYYGITSVRARLYAITSLTSLFVLTVVAGDVYVVQSSCAVALLPWLLYFRRTGRLNTTAMLFAAALGIATGFSDFIRVNAGTAVLIIAIPWVATMCERRRRKILFIAIALITFSVNHLVERAVVHRRDAYLSAQDNAYHLSARHVIWHSTYAGLGFLENDYGLKYDDATAAKEAWSIDRNAVYLTPQYERALRKAVFDVVADHPKFVIGTLFVKASVLVLAFLIFANVGVVAAVRHPKPLLVEVVFILGVGFTALPSLLTVPQLNYMLGFLSFAALYGIFSVEHANQQHPQASGGKILRQELVSEQVRVTRSEEGWEKVHVQ